jgi:hypothetical protein
MPWKPKTFGYDARHKKESRQRYDQQRGTAAERGPYNTKWWKLKRVEIASRDGWVCKEQGCGKDVGIKKGDFHCDHVEERPVGAPIDTERWDSDSNLLTRCDSCHNRKTAKRTRSNQGH